MSNSSDNKGNKRVEHCSTKSELKRIINRCHGNALHLSHLSNELNNYPYHIHNNTESCYCYKCLRKSEEYLQIKKQKLISKTEQFLAFFSFLLSNLVLSDVLFVWVAWFVLTR